MDMVHADGEVWEAIYETTADTLPIELRREGRQRPETDGLHDIGKNGGVDRDAPS